MSAELKPCRACGAYCRVEATPSADLWICSNAKYFGGDCPDETAYLYADAWNTRSLNDEGVRELRDVAERMMEVLEFAYMNAPEQPKELAQYRAIRAKFEQLP